MTDSNLSMDEMLARASEAAGFLKALGNERRLIILCNLVDQELSVSGLNERLPLSQSALSQHLAVLRKDGLVTTRRDSQTIYYSIGDERVRQLMQTMYTLFCKG
ncbi:ArsR/SmtB family transcription factor [Marinomonas balearica]|uniref:ArsR family transcriptional regulator n=1 Tax=Marinomonas balearica TaxID=491947 RepID=A0A4R6M6D0_9GAMM|nr:metalloregulator ArsR/SmtB family transcription factor [Marinomonas balearica]TDO96937.1 ArsR family transcriptional regulator [Marinomonas balearica]